MKVFPDTSVLLAACGSEIGASREFFRIARKETWAVVTTPFVLEEVENNIPDFGSDAMAFWHQTKANLAVCRDVLTMEWPSVFSRTKDRPVLFGAFAWADVLLTLDRRDFGGLIGTTFYGLPVMTPGMFVGRYRER
jgi:hypothetical protein